jgi:hypothetical protein
VQRQLTPGETSQKRTLQRAENLFWSVAGSRARVRAHVRKRFRGKGAQGMNRVLNGVFVAVVTVWFLYLAYKVAQHVGAWPFAAAFYGGFWGS